MEFRRIRTEDMPGLKRLQCAYKQEIGDHGIDSRQHLVTGGKGGNIYNRRQPFIQHGEIVRVIVHHINVFGAPVVFEQ